MLSRNTRLLSVHGVRQCVPTWGWSLWEWRRKDIITVYQWETADELKWIVFKWTGLKRRRIEPWRNSLLKIYTLATALGRIILCVRNFQFFFVRWSKTDRLHWELFHIFIVVWVLCVSYSWTPSGNNVPNTVPFKTLSFAYTLCLYVLHHFHNKHLLFFLYKVYPFFFIMDIHCVLCEVGAKFFNWFSWKAVLKGWYNFSLLLFYTKLWTDIILLSVLYFAPTLYDNFNHT